MQVWYVTTGGALAQFCGHVEGDQTVRVRGLAIYVTRFLGPYVHTSCVMTIAFSADGSRIAPSSVDQSVRVWSTNLASSLAWHKGHGS